MMIALEQRCFCRAVIGYNSKISPENTPRLMLNAQPEINGLS